jgi:hypothetical protein
VRQRAEGRLAACHRLGRRGRLDDPLAGAAAVLGAQVAHDTPADRHDVEHLIGIGAEPAQRAAAGWACASAGGGLVNDLMARQMRRQRADRCRPLRGLSRNGHARVGAGGFGFILFECQLELFDLARQLLGRGAEGHPAEPCKLCAEHRDDAIARVDLGLQSGDLRLCVGWRNGVLRHTWFLPDPGY